ncbi:DEAD/DEAH box helicase [Flavobacterium sediminilitoris]|uniref:DEAD/DEAH box helicase n=1 Tax=Flavobacterium sediminilitoris TaxID=2024526 RepID=A0ABY4HII7_9FLAO|nr:MULTISPECIES: DEAD/DEAH box helicase [Flavobacterium]UOX32378.1 DEAD/DEAH box helicase [Flavobacterium sediminilitoris]
MNKNLEKVYNNTFLNESIEKLVVNVFYSKIGKKPIYNFEKVELRKLIWLSSIIALSYDFKHQKKAQEIAILLFLNFENDVEILKSCYVLFSRVGNLTATKFLKPIFSNDSDNPLEQIANFNEDVYLEKELLNKRVENLIKINENYYLVTDFQSNLFKNLLSSNYVSISAPTSSGKSFIIKKYIEEQFYENEEYIVFYIVPSRALINQVTEELRLDLNNVEIKTAYIEEETEISKKVIYVITPERAIKIINSEEALLLPNLIFIDEIQGVEDEYGRGNLFEYVFEEFSKTLPKTKIITAGPNILNPNKLYSDLFNKESEVVSSELSPVFQLKTIISLDENSLGFTIYTSEKRTFKVENAIEISSIKKIFNSNIGNAISLILSNLIKDPNSSNLIYAYRGDYAEIWALKFANEQVEQNEIEPEIRDLINYLKEDIHPKYNLILCLQKGIGFHHGTLPEFVRKEIETLFEKGLIKTLFCTSTLLEGVNLPADNLFILKPNKDKIPLSNFEFGNLIGRAGRLKNSLYGSIFCITSETNSWAENYYEADYHKEVVTSITRNLKNINLEDLGSSTLNIDDGKIKNLVNTLRHKYLHNEDNLVNFLTKKGFSESQINKAVEIMKNSFEDFKLPLRVIKKNPSIDPILQNELYKKIQNDGIKKWVINAKNNSNLFEKYTRVRAVEINYENNSFYWQLDSIITRLNDIFGITEEIFRKDSISIYPSGICINSINWIQGKSIKELIMSRIDYISSERVHENFRIDRNDVREINKVIKDVIKINSKIITFVMLKYIKLLSDILEEILNEEEKELYKLTLALPIHLELGTQDKVTIRLITSGVPRTIALKINKIFSKTEDAKNDIDVLVWMKNKDFIIGIEPIYNKYLSRNNFLNQNINLQ